MNIRLLPAGILRSQDGRGTDPATLGNGAAVLAWHHAQGGGATLVRTVVDRSHRIAASNWVAVIDDELSGDVAGTTPHTSLAQLRALVGNRIRATAFERVPPPQLALIDRDGTVMVDRHYLADPEGVELLPGAAEGLRLLRSAGVRLALVSNQSGIAQGRITQAQLEAVNHRLTELLAGENVSLERIYICPHAPADRCDCRKPAPGMALQAARDLGVDLQHAVVAGDKAADLGLARAIGAPAVLVTSGEGAATLASGEVAPDYVVDDLATLARIRLHPDGLLRSIPLPG